MSKELSASLLAFAPGLDSPMDPWCDEGPDGAGQETSYGGNPVLGDVHEVRSNVGVDRHAPAVRRTA